MIEAAIKAGKGGGDRQQSACSPSMAPSSQGLPRRQVFRSLSRPRSPAASRSSRRCAKRLPAIAITASPASSTAPATTSSPAWRPRSSPSRTVSPTLRSLGYAEADPTFDVGGFDTAHKLAILTSLAFGTEIDADAIHVEGIASITPARSRDGRRARLPHQAPRRRRAHRERRRAARAPDHGGEERGHRRGDGRDQCGHRSTRDAVRRTHARRARRRRRRHRLGGRGRHRRHRARAPARRPSAARSTRSPSQCEPRCSATRAAITSASRSMTVRAPRPPSPPAWPSRRSRSKASCRSGRARRPPRARPQRCRERGSGGAHHLRDGGERHPGRRSTRSTADGHIAEPPQVIRIERE